MEKGNTVYSFTYDAFGRPVAITEGNTRYFYVLNQQGDVVAIINGNGDFVVEYYYDAWGRLLSATGTLATTLGTNNPLRYRGYVYDTETGLYYLQSRYYNPTWGRFINADSQLSTGDVSGLNLFAYCGNNPVNRIDPTGEAWYHWLIGGVVVAACAVATVATCGGFSAAITSIGLVSHGIAAASTAATVATAAFIGSATAYGTALLTAASNSNSLDEFYAQGNWGTVAATTFFGSLGALDGYCTYQTQSSQYKNAYNLNGGKDDKYLHKRGWTDQRLRHVIHNGRQGVSTTKSGELCTAYGVPGLDNQYVVINNSTRSVVQVSNLYDSGWIVDDKIKWAP